MSTIQQSPVRFGKCNNQCPLTQEETNLFKTRSNVGNESTLSNMKQIKIALRNGLKL